MNKKFFYDFSGISDNDPFPEGFSFAVISDDAGVDSTIIESDPLTYFFVLNDKALFNYTEEVVGPVTNLRGVLASPGKLDGTDAELSVAFCNPLDFFNVNLDEFFFQIGIGGRSEGGLLEWTGGIIESHYTGGTWSPRWKYSAVTVVGDVFTVLDSEEDTDDDHYVSVNSLIVIMEGTTLRVNFNGVREVETTLSPPVIEVSSTVIFVKTFTRVGAVITPFETIYEISGKSLRSGRKTVFKEPEGQHLAPPNDEKDIIVVPIRELREEGIILQISENSWKFMEEKLVQAEGHTPFLARPGTIIVAHRENLKDARVQTCRYKFDVN